MDGRATRPLTIVLKQLESTSHSAFITGTLDARGRITIPARVRDRYDLGRGDALTLLLAPATVDRVQVDSVEAAKQALEEYDAVRQFRYQDGVLEVVCDA